MDPNAVTAFVVPPPRAMARAHWFAVLTQSCGVVERVGSSAKDKGLVGEQVSWRREPVMFVLRRAVQPFDRVSDRPQRVYEEEGWRVELKRM